MKYLLFSLILVSCGNASKIANPPVSASQLASTRSGAAKSPHDTVYILLPAPSVPTRDYISITDIGCTHSNDCGKIISDYVMSKPKNTVVSFTIPPGDFYISTTLYVEDRVLNLIGAGSNKTHFYVKEGIVGIWLDRKRGILSKNYLANFWMGAGAKGKNADADGIRLWHETIVNNVSVSNFGGCGIHIDGYVIGDPDKDAAHNASFCKVYDCNITANAQDGILIDGSDGNGCITMGNDIRNNGGWGLRESSFLGGTHIGNMFHANKTGPFTVDHPTNASAFIGGYTEGDQTPALIYSTNQTVGKQQWFSGVKNK